MLKRTILKGTVVLAASAAAAMSACGNGAQTSDGGGGEGGNGGASTGGTSTGGVATGGAATGGDATGGTSTGGKDNMGGGGSGSGGAPPVTAQDFVDLYCPAADYTIVEGDAMANTYSEYVIGEPTAIVSWGEADSVSADGDSTTRPATSPLCVIGGEGDDYVRVYGSSGGTAAGDYSGSAPTVTFVGGTGADQLQYTVYTSNTWSGYYRPAFTFKDFKSGVDKIEIIAASASVNWTQGTSGVLTISNFGPANTAEYFSTTDWALVVDPADGEVWLSANNEGTQINVLIGVVEGDTLAAGDVIVTPPPT
jgi:hypothetical protein